MIVVNPVLGLRPKRQATQQQEEGKETGQHPAIILVVRLD
jgi:hypothetical protein